ncbi:MAG: dihydroorotate dehydrogenase (quinone) [Helicobacter sp.]|nr:dihydroorotate dehydrogenase (quinone) [Helicobacter sp.]
MNYNLLKKLLFCLDPERAHALASVALKIIPKITPDPHESENEVLGQKIFGLNFSNPIGLAGGFDKNASMILGICALDFGFLELGTVTNLPQNGNAKPRLFRHINERSLQNAMGFNNKGVLHFRNNLNQFDKPHFKTPLFLNIGKNKDVPNTAALKDYENCLYKLADFTNLPRGYVFNLSSPNTTKLRDLQNESFVKDLLQMAKELLNKNSPIFIKISPDMPDEAMLNLVDCAISNGVSGIIATNTTINYSLIKKPFCNKDALPFGGISGAVLKQRSTEVLRLLAKHFFGKTTLISVGGIENADDVYKRIKLGANLVQIYTALIYEGPNICKKINKAISLKLQKDGFTNISQAIGVEL